ncbi:hypothetical protein ABPG77_011041 [Micractinium sp. CCAP 211/92]
MEPADFTALPQRPQRERRSSKRPRVCDGETASTAQTAAASGGEAVAAAAASELQAGLGSDQLQQEGEEQLIGQQNVHQLSEQQQRRQDGEERVAGSGADATPPAAQLDLPAYRSAAVGDHKFECKLVADLDHTADVQLHAWGGTLREAFENVALCMFNYMTPLKGISVDPAQTRRYEAEGHDLHSLLFNFLDELLFAFATDFFVAKRMRITRFDRADRASQGGGGADAGDSTGGTGADGAGGWRIEAEGEGERFDRARHACGTEVKAITYSAMQINETPGDAEVFVIVDI